MSEITISTEGLKAFAREVAVQTVKAMRKQTLSKSEYAREYSVSRTTVNRMIARGELKVDKHGKIIIQ